MWTFEVQVVSPLRKELAQLQFNFATSPNFSSRCSGRLSLAYVSRAKGPYRVKSSDLVLIQDSKSYVSLNLGSNEAQFRLASLELTVQIYSEFLHRVPSGVAPNLSVVARQSDDGHFIHILEFSPLACSSMPRLNDQVRVSQHLVSTANFSGPPLGSPRIFRVTITSLWPCGGTGDMRVFGRSCILT